jgi:branched-chain amino acid aminotransferase
VEVVVPDSKNVIKSVTSDSICQIARHWGWNVEQRPVSFSFSPFFVSLSHFLPSFFTMQIRQT